MAHWGSAAFRLLGTVLLGLVCLTGLAQAQTMIIIHAGTLLAVPGEEPQTSVSIIIENNRIRAVRDGYVRAADLGGDATVIDLKDGYVLPGLIDGHVHITSELGPRRKLQTVEDSEADYALAGADNARKTLMAGFTTIRELGATGGDAVFALRDAINKGFVPGPRMFVAGKAISPTGGHGQTHGFRNDIDMLMRSPGICDGVADCRRAVRNMVRLGADQIKLVATGGVLSETDAGTDQAFFQDELEAIMDTTHLLGRKAAAHAHGAAGINAALKAGVDSIEHGTYANAESFRLMRRNGAYLVPTILAGITVAEMAAPETTFMPPPIRKKALAVGPQILGMAGRAHKAGVKIAFGTDTGVSAHGNNAREFELLVQAGLTPMEAIRTATVHGADSIGRSGDLGTVEVGKFADIVAVMGEDPTQNISALRDVDFVMKDGVVYKNP